MVLEHNESTPRKRYIIYIEGIQIIMHIYIKQSFRVKYEIHSNYFLLLIIVIDLKGVTFLISFK